MVVISKTATVRTVFLGSDQTKLLYGQNLAFRITRHRSLELTFRTSELALSWDLIGL
jgi:hypothetical protein